MENVFAWVKFNKHVLSSHYEESTLPFNVTVLYFLIHSLNIQV